MNLQFDALAYLDTLTELVCAMINTCTAFSFLTEVGNVKGRNEP